MGSPATTLLGTERAALLADHDTVAVLTDLDGTVVAASPGTGRALGIDDAEIVGSALYQTLPSRDASETPRLVAWLLGEGHEEAVAAARFVDADGCERRLRLVFTLVTDAAGAPGYLFATGVPDRSERRDDPAPVVDARRPGHRGGEADRSAPPLARRRRSATDTGPGVDTDEPPRSTDRSPRGSTGTRAAAYLAGRHTDLGDRQETWVETLVTAIGDLALRFDGNGRVIDMNRAAQEVFGPASDLTAADLYPTESFRRLLEDAAPTVMSGEAWHGALDMRRHDGRLLTVHQTLVSGPAGTHPARWVAVLGQDVSDEHALAGELLRRATHDALTGLLNRSSLLEEVRQRALRAAGGGHRMAVGFLDLDRFKGINDTHGHAAADHLLRLVARRIGNALRDTDVAGRLGGDEFVVVLDPVAGEQEAYAALERITRSIGSSPFRLGESEVQVTVSAGLAMGFGDAEPERLVRDADAAMYLAKSRGRARLEVFDDEMRRRRSRRARLVEDLRDALDIGAIGIHLQPTYDLQTGVVRGVEALARWDHPVEGMLTPTTFIDVAEESGLIVRLGLAVLHRACQEAVRWAAVIDHPPPVHVNVSARQLRSENFADLAMGVVDNFELDPSAVIIEITESLLIEDRGATEDVIASLRDHGFRMAIDDFGTGYSSLSYLQRLQADILKIDRSFVEAMEHDTAAMKIVAAIVGLAHTLDMRVIAEGVEHEWQAQQLRAIDCDGVQGFHYCPPVPPDELIEHLRTSTAPLRAVRDRATTTGRSVPA